MNDKSKKEFINHKHTIKEFDASSGQDFSPSKFMRARRPELFSDSKIIAEPRLTREVFEYHLHTLTSRKQETEFEHFCRRLAEKELCPNLIPQTGPTGGGDSKVDAETYPVADEISMRWYEGLGREAGRERWAFAFSAQKAWKPKLHADVKKIIETGRDYKHIYFITNQFVKDKERAKLEDALSKKYSVGVHIFDRTWLIKCVFEHNRLRLATETLNLTEYDESTRKVVGPLDTERAAELKELEQQIEDSNRYRGVEYQLAEDCLQSAFLARGLERPRVEVDGRFSRAARVADNVGNRQQILRIAYAKTWTAFWWYDDFAKLNRLYDQVEGLILGSMQAADLELLANLWTVLYSSVMQGRLTAKEANLDTRTEKLKSELERIAAEKHRPNNALLAHTCRLLIDLSEAVDKKISLDVTFADLKKALIASKGLTEFPTTSITRIIQELGDFFADSASYDELFDVVVNLTKQRATKGETGILLLQRGQQKLMAGKKYDAIRLLGQAQQKLAMSEYREDWIRSLASCGLAYEAAGLLWAARANTLIAANQELSEFQKHGKMMPQALRGVQKLVWLEIQLGRVFHALAWVELASGIARHLILEGDRREAFLEQRQAQDRVLGLLLLKTDIWELKWLGFLPQILEDLGFEYSRMALLYALGHEEQLRSEGIIPLEEDPESVQDLFKKWLEQPANEDLPDRPDLMRGSKVILRSYVLGCEVIVDAANNPASLNLGETILGALEALLATCIDLKVGLFPYRPELKIVIQPSDFIEGLPEYKISEVDGGQTIYIRHSQIFQRSTGHEAGAFRSWLLKFILETTFQIAVVNDPRSFKKQIIKDEDALGRALNFSDVGIPVENILGEAPKFRPSDWEAQVGTERFVLQRDVSWDHGLKETNNETVGSVTLTPRKEEPPDELFGIDKLKHKERRIVSLINIPLWDKAEWRGTLYMCYPSAPPVLAVGFSNPEVGKQIFKELRSKLGQVDEKERLRISVITGIDKKYPSSYRVVISTNVPPLKPTQKNYFIMVSRMNRMDPIDLRNLNAFLNIYKCVGTYIIMPVGVNHSGTTSEPFFDLSIVKRELNIRSAWEIGENDSDVWGIQEDDDPIIPNGVVNAPVLRTLQRFKKSTKYAARNT